MSATTSAVRQAAYVQRRKNGLQPVAKPWEWLTLSEVQKLALDAYKVASYALLQDAQESDFTVQCLREQFAQDLAETFKNALDAYAVTEGMCWPVDTDTPLHENYPLVWANLCGDVPEDWRPQYPVYKQVTPASVRTAPGAVINADEGNVNDCNFTR